MGFPVAHGLLLFIALYLINSNHFVASRTRHLYTKEELKVLDKFRPLVENYLTLDFQRTDGYLLRWLRGNNLDVRAATEALKKNHQWRKENKIDSILDGDQEIPRDLPYTVSGVDKGGRPLAIHPFGKWSIRKYVISGNQHIIVRQYQRMYEDAIRKAFLMADRNGRDVDQIYVITDLQGYSIREHSCLQCVGVTLDFARSFASGVVPFAKNITLVNTPQIFQPVLSLAKAIVYELPINDYDSKKQIWQQELFKDISPDQLPAIYSRRN